MTRKKGISVTRYVGPVQAVGSRVSRGVLKAEWVHGGARFEQSRDMQTWVSTVSNNGAVNVKQAAALLFVTPMTVHRWVMDGWLKALPKQRQGQLSVRLSELRKLAVERGFFVGVEK